MMRVNDMTEQDRRIHRVVSGLIVDVPERGKVSIFYMTPRGELVREKLFCADWQTVVPMQTVIDFQPYLSSANSIGIRILGATPEHIAEPVRQAVLARMNE